MVGLHDLHGAARGLHGLAQRFEGFLRLRVGSTLQERGAHVRAVHQGRRQRRDHLGGGDAHGAVDAVNQLICAKDQVLGAEGRTLWGKQRVLRGMLNAIAQGDDLVDAVVLEEAAGIGLGRHCSPSFMSGV